MKRICLLFSLISILIHEGFSQKMYTPYDELPGINKIYKPGYEEYYEGWQKMLYQYPVNFYEINDNFIRYEKEHKGQKIPIVKYYKLWRMAVEPYVDSEGNINVNDISAIHAGLYAHQKNAYVKQKAASINNSNWTFLGPKQTYNIVGTTQETVPGTPLQVNVYCIDVANTDNTILYCGTETGCVNKTTNRGLSWKQVGADYYFGGPVEAIVIDPEDTETVYVSAGDQIHKTSDGGITWIPLLTEPTRFDAVKIKINPQDNNVILAAAAEGVYRSENKGNSWEMKLAYPTYAVEFDAANPSIVYALSKNPSGNFTFVSSDNGGKSFTFDSGFPTIPDKSGGLLAVTTADPSIIYVSLLAKENDGDCVYIYKGTKEEDQFIWTLTKKGDYRMPAEQNGGDFQGGGFNPGWGYFDLIFDVSPINANTIFFGTCTAWKSTDGGYNFSKLGGYGGEFPLHPDIQDIKVLKSGETWISTDGGINHSTDFFTSVANWSNRTNGVVGSDFWGFDQGWNEDIIVGGRYHNGNTAIADFYGDKSLGLLTGESPTGWVIKGKSRQVVFSDFNAGNGVVLPKEHGGSIEGYFPFTKHPNMDYYGGKRGNVVSHPNYYGTVYLGEGDGFWRSTDRGSTFELLHQFPGRVRYFQISYKNPDVIYIDVVNNGLYRSEDGGITWVKKPSLTNGINGTSSWNGNLFFDISPYNENKIYACIAHGGLSNEIGKVFYSNDGGDTWHDWTDGLNELTKCMVIQPTEEGKDLVYLFSSAISGLNTAKVFCRKEDQANWESFDTNYPLGFRTIHALPFFRDAKIRVAGNAGVWESSMADSLFSPLINPWVENKYCICPE